MSVEIQKYKSLGEFQRDAAVKAGQGWSVAAQSTSSGMSRAGEWMGALGIVAALAGFFVFGTVPLVLGIALFLVGVFSRTTAYTVTYSRADAPPD